MVIETKFDIDNNVWFVGNGSIGCGRIVGIEISVISIKGPHTVKYNVFELPNSMYDFQLFETKEALIQSL